MKPNSEVIYAIRCFINGQRAYTDELTKDEAGILRATARHLISYLEREYGLDKEDGEKEGRIE